MMQNIFRDLKESKIAAAACFAYDVGRCYICYHTQRKHNQITMSLKNLGTSLFAGKWKGSGKVLKSTGEVAAAYKETAVFEITRKTPAFVVYRVHQDTQHAESSKPMHTETGFCRIMEETGQATMSVVHPFPKGMVSELCEGQLDLSDGKLTLVAREFMRAVKSDSLDKQVTGYKREYKRDGDKLVYDQYLASGGGEMYHHLHCEMELEAEC